MRKLLSLYQNEMGKVLRKVSVLVVMILLFVIIGGCAMVRKGTESFSSTYSIDYSEMAQYYDRYAKEHAEEVSAARMKLGTIDHVNDQETFVYTASMLITHLKDQKCSELISLLYKTVAGSGAQYSNMFDSSIDKTVTRIYNELYYNNDNEPDLSTPEALAEEELRINTAAESLKPEIDSLKILMTAVTFRELLDNQLEVYKEYGRDDGSYEIFNEVYGWLDKYADDVKVEHSDYIMTRIDKYVSNTVSLKRAAEPAAGKHGVSFSEESLRRETALIEYAFRHGTVVTDAARSIAPENNRETMNYLCGIGTFVIAALVIMLAGSSISSEMNNGSIKSLIIAPVRRGKIFAAKGLMLLTVQTALLLYDYLLTLLFTGTLFGFRNFGTLVFYAFGQAHGIPYLLAALLSLMLDGLAIGLFAAAAMALSAATHNTAVSVTLPMLGFFGGMIVEVIMQLRAIYRRAHPDAQSSESAHIPRRSVNILFLRR